MSVITFKGVAYVSLGNVLTTELNSLASGGFSALGTAYDNTSGLYRYGFLLVNLASLNPTAGAYFQAFMTPALDGTNYDDPPSSTNPGVHMALPLATVTTGSATKRFQIGGTSQGQEGFRLPAALLKFAALNGAGVGLAASANTVALYGAYEQGVY